MSFIVCRRAAVLGAAAVAVIGSAAGAAPPAPVLSLRTVPMRIYRSRANQRENLDGWAFFLMLESRQDEPFTPVELRLVYRARAAVLREERMTGASLAGIARQDIPPTRLNGRRPDPPVYWPQAFRIHCNVPSAPAVDELLVELRVSARDGRTHTVHGRIPIVEFVQRTSLIFPFRGPGIISQAGVLSGGHRNRSGGFAIDALGLDLNYAPVTRRGSDRPEDYAGWGRPIIAPAAGLVVQARNDRPDQPKDGESNPAYYASEYPGGGDVGNHIVIDHGHREFSLLAHLRAGSVQARPGDRVEQGDRIGELGNSGDTTGPHLHYQLQDGPRWGFSDGLPVSFTNLSSLARGSYFDAR